MDPSVVRRDVPYRPTGRALQAPAASAKKGTGPRDVDDSQVPFSTEAQPTLNFDIR
jgi:hypothetical protein